jgi:hypothetical protein
MSGGRRAAAILFAASIVWPNASFAQRNPPPAAAPSLTPPVLQGSTDVPYRKGAKGDAVVGLELTIEKDGTVSRAVVTEGVEPFAEQARQAVLGWRFTPALRGSTPVGARIRARVELRQVEIPSAPHGSTTGTWAASCECPPRDEDGRALSDVTARHRNGAPLVRISFRPRVAPRRRMPGPT